MATHVKMPSEDNRLLNWDRKVEEIDRTGRAFGRFGSLAEIGGEKHIVFAYDIWKEKHGFQPGQIAVRTSREITVAARDGFVCLKDFQKL